MEWCMVKTMMSTCIATFHFAIYIIMIMIIQYLQPPLAPRFWMLWLSMLFEISKQAHTIPDSEEWLATELDNMQSIKDKQVIKNTSKPDAIMAFASMLVYALKLALHNAIYRFNVWRVQWYTELPGAHPDPNDTHATEESDALLMIIISMVVRCNLHCKALVSKKIFKKCHLNIMYKYSFPLDFFMNLGTHEPYWRICSIA